MVSLLPVGIKFSGGMVRFFPCCVHYRESKLAHRCKGVGGGWGGGVTVKYLLSRILFVRYFILPARREGEPNLKKGKR